MEDIKVIIRDTIYSNSNEEDREYLEEVLNDLGYYKQIKWISVEERLPPKHETVLVYTCGGVDTDFISSGAWYEHRHILVTHWMPLPQPPKKKGENDDSPTDT